MKKAKFLLRLTILTGIIIILGTAGASDLNRIGLSKCYSQVIFGTLLILSGKFGLSLLKALKPVKRRKGKIQKHKTRLARQANAA